MALTSGTKLGPYEIQSLLGAGGMGEVYRARDTRLERTVAIKILNSSLTATPDLKARFEREAKVISQLQHPHICVLHDIGSHNGTDFLVMEFLEGETLSERLQKGPLPTGELLKIATQVAAALEKAHRAGIVHRDLKPGNVMLTKSGAKLLDFGLAKSISVLITDGSSVSQSMFTPAITQSMRAPMPAAAPSASGSLVGTVPYMSPEQVQRLPIDARSDIFSFGTVLYEMVTGKRSFSGNTAASVAGQILAIDPPAPSSFRPQTPAALDRVIRVCLEKDPDERFQSAHDLKLQLQMIAEGLTTAAPPKPMSPRVRGGVITTAFLLMLALAAAAYFGFAAQHPQPTVRSLLLPPDDAGFANEAGVPVLSPDGTTLAFVGVDEKSISMLYVRPMNSSMAQPLAGTEGANFPFWSPDSQNLGFFVGTKLLRIPVAGGPVLHVADLSGSEARGGTWSATGTILTTSNIGSHVIMQVSAAGGTLSAASKLNPGGSSQPTEYSHWWPFFLPDGKHFFFGVSPLAWCVWANWAP